MKQSTWRPALALAAATVVATPAAAEQADTATYDIRAEWLDPAVVDHPKTHQRIMTELATQIPLNSRRLDELGLNSEAARAFALARNTGDLFFPRYDQSPKEWFKATEPQLEQIVNDHRAARRTQAAYVLGTMGATGAAGLGLIAWKTRRRNKQSAQQSQPAPAQSPAPSPTPGMGGR